MKSLDRFSFVGTAAAICFASFTYHAWSSPQDHLAAQRKERTVPKLPSQASRAHNIVVRVVSITPIEKTDATHLLKLEVERYYGKITTDSLNRAKKHETMRFSILFPASPDADIRAGDLINYWLVGYTPMRGGNVADNGGVAP